MPNPTLKVDAIEVASNVAAGAVGLATAASGAATAAAGMSVAAGIAGAVRVVHRAWAERQDERVRMFVADVFLENASAEGFASHVAALLERPRTRRVFMEGIRAALEAVADEVLPALALLLREYERTDQEPDGRFRALCRVLQDLSADEYRSMRALFRGIASDRAVMDGPPGDSFIVVRAILSRRGKSNHVVAGREDRDPVSMEWREVGQICVPDCTCQHLYRLAHLIVLHGLGDEASGMAAPEANGIRSVDKVELRPETVRWIAGFLVR